MRAAIPSVTRGGNIFRQSVGQRHHGIDNPSSSCFDRESVACGRA